MVVWCADWPLVAAGVALAVARRGPARQPGGGHARRRPGPRGSGPGLRRREAQARCPQVELLDHDPARDARAFEAVAGAVEAVTPRVELTRPGVCSFPTRGPSRYFGGDEALAGRVAGLVAAAVAGASRVGVADGPFAAVLAARRGVVVPPGATPPFLAPFPVGVLEDEALTDVLVRLGIATLADLAALPRADLMARFGWPGERAHRLASGDDARLPDTRPPPPDLVATVELDPPGRAGRRRRLRGQAPGRRPPRAPGRPGPVLRPGPGDRRDRARRGHQRCWRHEGALTAPAMAERVRWQLEGWLGSSAASRPTGGIALLRLEPSRGRRGPGPPARLLGRRDGGRRAGRPAPWPGWTACSGPGRPPSPSGGAAAARPRPWAWSRPTPSTSPSARWPRAEVDRPLARTPAHARPRPGSCPPRCGPRWSTARTGPSGSAAGAWPPPLRPGCRIDGGPPQAVAGWAGPWPVDERWWDTATHRRRARFQVLTDEGIALLLAVEDGRWWLEATYD